MLLCKVLCKAHFGGDMTLTVEGTSRMSEDTEKISLETLSQLTGFSSELIKRELLLDEAESNQDISLEKLREVILKFINQEMGA